jgi:prepilin peptidase CpaA
MDLPIQDPKFLLALALLMVGMGTDLSSQKYPNKIFLASMLVAATLSFAVDGIGAWQVILAQWGLAFAFFLPIYALKAVAAGDVKLMMAVAPLMSSQQLFLTILASLFWGGLLGLFSVILKNNLSSMWTNLQGLLLFRNRPKENSLNRIPYTVALLVGYLSSFLLQKTSGGWL